MSEYKENRANKVIIELEPIDSTKKTDMNRNKTRNISVNAIRDEQTNLWRFQFFGVTPSAIIQSKFTNFNKLIDFGKVYFSNRNLRIKDMING